MLHWLNELYVSLGIRNRLKSQRIWSSRLWIRWCDLTLSFVFSLFVLSVLSVARSLGAWIKLFFVHSLCDLTLMPAADVILLHDWFTHDMVTHVMLDTEFNFLFLVFLLPCQIHDITVENTAYCAIVLIGWLISVLSFGCHAHDMPAVSLYGSYDIYDILEPNLRFSVIVLISPPW